MSNVSSAAMDSLFVFGERYQMTPARQQSVLEDYLFVRAFQPKLSLDEFLLAYTQFVDKSSPSWPDTALKLHCSDLKAWPVKKRVALLCVICDSLQLLAEQDQHLPITLADFLGRLADGVASGNFPLPEPSAAVKRSRKRAAVVRDVFVPADGLRCVYTVPENFDLPGVLRRGFGDSWAFLSDYGELLQDITVGNCHPPNELVPELPDTTATMTQELVLVEASDWNQRMAVRDPLVEFPIGAEIDMRTVSFGDVKIKISLKNGETGPYVDPVLLDSETGHVLAHGRPREFSVLGYYLLKYDNAVYKLDVVTETAQEAPDSAQGPPPQPVEAQG